MLLTLTDSLQEKLQALHRSELSGSPPVTGGGNRGKKRRANEAHMRYMGGNNDGSTGNRPGTPATPFSIAERKAAGAGANGTFRSDDTPRTCNNCNSPDHLMGDCKQKGRNNAFKSHNGNKNKTKNAEPKLPSKGEVKKTKAELKQLKASLDAIITTPVDPATVEAFQPPPTRTPPARAAAVAAPPTSADTVFRQAVTVSQAMTRVAELCASLSR